MRTAGRSVVRRNLVAQVTWFGRDRCCELLAQRPQLLAQLVDFLLLAIHGPVERFEQVVGEAELDLKFSDARVGVELRHLSMRRAAPSTLRPPGGPRTQ